MHSAFSSSRPTPLTNNPLTGYSAQRRISIFDFSWKGVVQPHIDSEPEAGALPELQAASRELPAPCPVEHLLLPSSRREQAGQRTDSALRRVDDGEPLIDYLSFARSKVPCLRSEPRSQLMF